MNCNSHIGKNSSFCTEYFSPELSVWSYKSYDGKRYPYIRSYIRSLFIKKYLSWFITPMRTDHPEAKILHKSRTHSHLMEYCPVIFLKNSVCSALGSDSTIFPRGRSCIRSRFRQEVQEDRYPRAIRPPLSGTEASYIGRWPQRLRRMEKDARRLKRQ